jgi:hypothetical protein
MPLTKPLEKQTAVVPFVGGVQTKQNEYLVQPPNLLTLENGVFRVEGEIAKRFGFSSLSNLDSSGLPIEGKKLLTFNDDLVLMSQTRLYSYAARADKWFDKGAFASVTATKASVVRNRASQMSQCTATNRDVTVVAWKDSRGPSLRYAIIDEDTQTAIKSDAVLSNSGIWVVASKFLTSFLVLLYAEAGALKAKIIDTSTFQEYDQTISGIAVGTAVAASVTQLGTNLVVLYPNGSNFPEISAIELDTDALVPSLIEVGGPGGVVDGSNTMTSGHLVVDTSTNLQIYAVYSSGTAVRLQGMFQSLQIDPTHNVAVATAAATVPRVSGLVQPNGTLVVCWETSAASSLNHTLSTRHYTYNSQSAPAPTTSAAIVKRSLGLAGHMFTAGDAIYIIGAHESPLQPTIFLLQYISQSSVPVAGKFLTSIAGGHPFDSVTSAASSMMSVPQLDSSGKTLVSLPEVTRLVTESGTITDNTGLVKLKLDFTNPPFVGQQLGQNLMIAGGFISNYDGASVTEHGFHLYPENVTMTTPTGGSLVAGTYNVRVIYEWADAKGQIHRSAPSITVSEAAALNDQLTIVIPTVRLSSKNDVSIAVYCTPVNGTIYYRAGTVANNPGADTVSFSITSVATLTSQEILYTTGGVVENIAPPAATLVQRHKNRMFLGGLENDNELRYSQESTQNEGLGFSDFFIVRVNPAGGPVTALWTLDDKLIVFKRNNIFALPGEGPTPAGSGNDYQQPEEIASDVGCNNPSSLVTTPDGIMFSSDKGIKLLTRALAVEDIGGPVDEFSSLGVTSAILIPEYDEARFTTSTGVALVYNYIFKLWSTFSNYDARSAVNWLSSYLHLDDAGVVQKEVTGNYKDNNRPIPLKLKTSWIALAGLQGYKRIYRILFLGQKLSEHSFRVNIRYDYDPLIRETVYFNTLEQMNQETVPQDTTWIGLGETVVGSAKTEVMQFEIAPRIQKCESIQLEIEDITQSTGSGASYSMSGLTFLLGITGGTANLTTTIGSKR